MEHKESNNDDDDDDDDDEDDDTHLFCRIIPPAHTNENLFCLKPQHHRVLFQILSSYMSIYYLPVYALIYQTASHRR